MFISIETVWWMFIGIETVWGIGKILVLLSFVSHTHRIYFDYYASHNILFKCKMYAFSAKSYRTQIFLTYFTLL